MAEKVERHEAFIQNKSSHDEIRQIFRELNFFYSLPSELRDLFFMLDDGQKKNFWSQPELLRPRYLFGERKPRKNTR